MNLLVSIPSMRAAPLRWVTDIVFHDMLGLTVRISEHAEASVVISGEGRTLEMPSLFPSLDAGKTDWAAQIPDPPLTLWDVAETLPEAGLEPALPVLFGRPEMVASHDSIHCGVDVFGSIFFMLSRFEEVALAHRDAHDRFPATASLAHKGGFLYRPIVDEYAAVLWAMMKRLWPGLTRKARQGQVRVSCDVDQPFDRVGVSPKALVRSLGGDLGRRRDPALAIRRMRNFFAHRRGDLRFDPYYTFDWYIDTCERHGRKAAFYFISDRTAGAIDGTYDIGEPRILSLMTKLEGRGHEIGMHGSYNTFRDPAQIARERQRLAQSRRSAGLPEDISGNRQHYLRWDAAETPNHLEAAGFAYDTTGSFADRPGFRYGTSHSFPMWSWRTKAPLRLRQVPLVVMECSVMSKGYLGLGRTAAAVDLMLELKRRSLRYGGDFTLLWHNSEFLAPKDREIFDLIIR